VSRSTELSSEEVKPESQTEFFIEVNKEQSVSTDKTAELLIQVSEQGSVITDKIDEVPIQASDQGSVSGVEEQNMFVVNISGPQHGEKLENVATGSISEIDISTEEDESRGTRIRRLFNFKPQKKNPEELKGSLSVKGGTPPVSDQKRAHSSPSPWPNIVKRAGLTFERLKAGTPDSVISVLQRFRPKSSRDSSPDRNHELPPRSPVRTLGRLEELGSPTIGRLRALRKRLHTMGRQAGTRRERFQGDSSLSSSDLPKENEGIGGELQTDSRQSRLHSSIERLRVEVQRPPNWLREHFLRRCNLVSQDLQRQNRDQDPIQEPTSPAVARSPPHSPHRLSPSSWSRRQQEIELDIVEQSMKMDEILRLPMIRYKPKADTPIEICVVCTEDFKPGETQRVLTCFHTFHQGCIDEWLFNYCPWDNLICPICKTMQYSFLDPAFGNKGAKEEAKQ